MRRWCRLLLPILLLPGTSAVLAQVAPIDWLLQQVRIGEANNRFELVTQSLYRLDKIDPDNPQVLAAKLRLALRQGDQARAQALMAQLTTTAPGSLAARQAAASLLLIEPVGRQQLQQARLLTAAGRLDAAQAAWDALFHGVFPSDSLALEYWRLVARLPGQQVRALAAMQALNAATPGNAELQVTLAQLQQSQQRSVARQQAASLGAQGQALAASGQRSAAIGLFQRALQADKGGDGSSKWQSLLRTSQYWLAIERGDALLAHGDIDGAQQQFQQAQKLDASESYALIGLGDVAQARQQPAVAEQHFQRALQLDPANATALRRLVSLYQQQSVQRALAFIASLPARQQGTLAADVSGLRSALLSDEGEQLAQQGQWAAAVEKYRQALVGAADDVWLNYRTAMALRAAGQRQTGEALMAALARRLPQDPTQVYVHALWLSANDQDNAALAALEHLPRRRWTADIQALFQRLALARQLDNLDALLAQQRFSAARQQLTSLPAAAADSVDGGRRVASGWLAVGETSRAAALYQQLTPQALREMPAQSSALLLRDAARLQARQGQAGAALDNYRQAMVASGIAAAAPGDNDTLTRLTRSQADDDWLKRGIRRETAELYRQQESQLTLAEDYSRNKGSGGVADFTAYTTMLQAETALESGRGWLRLDNVAVSAGSFSRNAAGHISDDFGTCASADALCQRDFHQRQTGTSIGLGYQGEQLSADLGTTPLGFAVTHWVGGLSWASDVGEIGVTLTASRRPIASSLLAFAGARDPNALSDKTWGGVVASGGALGLSYDRGGDHGVWADLSAHQLSGRNVQDNARERLMGGYYYKLVNDDRRRATIGLNAMLWHYDRDLSGYSLGQGGYYSPQRYASLSLPLNWRQRTDNWSYQLGGAVSLSHSRSDAQPRYPLNFGPLTRSNPPGSDGGGSGVGYTLQALVERRLSANWTLGLGMDIQQAKDYTPSHGLMYLRYSLAGWQGDLAMPPQPLTPYADFK